MDFEEWIWGIFLKIPILNDGKHGYSSGMFLFGKYANLRKITMELRNIGTFLDLPY